MYGCMCCSGAVELWSLLRTDTLWMRHCSATFTRAAGCLPPSNCQDTYTNWVDAGCHLMARLNVHALRSHHMFRRTAASARPRTVPMAQRHLRQAQQLLCFCMDASCAPGEPFCIF